MAIRTTDEAVRAMVRAGQIEDPEAERYIADALIERRDKIVRYYLSQINPLDGFSVTERAGESLLEFVNLGVEADLSSSCQYMYRWHRFDNETESLSDLGEGGTTELQEVYVPADKASFLMVRITSQCALQPKWQSAVDVYLRNGSQWSVVAIERAIPDE